MTKTVPAGTTPMPRKKSTWQVLKAQRYLQLFALAGIVYLLVFHYAPMFGIIIAFKKYRVTDGLMGFFTSPWVGLKYFKEFLSEHFFWLYLRNTLAMSVLKTVFTFPIPILFALMLNELYNVRFKKFVQTVSYLPHFISWVVVSGMLFVFFSTNGGVINEILLSLGLIDKSLPFLFGPGYFWALAVVSDAWKEFGWWAIIFIAAIAGIDPATYESAAIDGAGRMRRIWHITLPGITGAISIVLILSLGNLLGGGISGSNFDQSFLLGNALNSDTSEIIATYVLKIGLGKAQYSYATAVGVLQSLVSVMLLLGGNAAVKKISGTGII